MSDFSKALSVSSPVMFLPFPPVQFHPPHSARSAPVGVHGDLHVSPQSSPRPVHQQHLTLFLSFGAVTFSRVPSYLLVDPLHLLFCLLLSLASWSRPAGLMVSSSSSGLTARVAILCRRLPRSVAPAQTSLLSSTLKCLRGPPLSGIPMTFQTWLSRNATRDLCCICIPNHITYRIFCNPVDCNSLGLTAQARSLGVTPGSLLFLSYGTRSQPGYSVGWTFKMCQESGPLSPSSLPLPGLNHGGEPGFL